MIPVHAEVEENTNIAVAEMHSCILINYSGQVRKSYGFPHCIGLIQYKYLKTVLRK